jgi:hypothetical protein
MPIDDCCPKAKHWAVAKIPLRFILLALASLAAILVFVLLLHVREPRYHGQTLSYWTVKLKEGTRKEQAGAREALRAMGKSAVPCLIHILEKRDSPLKLKILTKYGQRWHFLYDWFPPTSPQTSSQSRAYAARALGEIGPPASNAIPALLRLSRTYDSWIVFTPKAALMKIRGEPIEGMIRALDDTSSEHWLEAARTLEEFGTNAKPAIPALCRALSSTNGWAAAAAIGAIHTEPETAVPALMDEIKRAGNVNTTWESIRALGEFEDESRPAIPLLRPFLLDANPWVRRITLTSLHKILPAAELKTLAPTLVQLTGDPNQLLRWFAQDMLKEIDRETAKTNGN